MGSEIQVVTFATNAFYRKEADRLVKTAHAVGVSVDVVHVDAPNMNWHQGVAYKCGVICSKIDNGPVLFIDSDAVLHRNPLPFFYGLMEMNIDFAARTRRGRLLSGTLWFNYSMEALDVLNAWQYVNYSRAVKGQVTGAGQANLETALRLVVDRVEIPEEWGVKQRQLNIANLPQRFCHIFDEDPEVGRDGKIVEPVIMHLQASREAMKQVHSDDQRRRRAAKIVEIESGAI